MVIIIMTIIFRQTQLGYQILKNTAKLSHLLYMDDLKLYGKSAAELESLLNTVITVLSSDYPIGYSAMTYRWNLA